MSTPSLSNTRIGQYPLYCVVSERWRKVGRGGAWMPDGFTYVNAKDAAHARIAFFTDRQHEKVRIVAIGPIVGFHAHDDNGDSLSL